MEELIEKIGWVTQPNVGVICDAIKGEYDRKARTPKKLAKLFCKMMIEGYSLIIRAHAAALKAFIDKTTEASEVHLPMLSWMTPEIIGP